MYIPFDIDLQMSDPCAPRGPWSPSSWQQFPVTQPVSYPETPAPVTEKLLHRLSTLPGLVHPHEIDRLRSELARAANGHAFVLQGGDCAERFAYCTDERIEAQLRVILQMSLVVVWGTGLPVVRVARMAGQYAKPRSSLMEKITISKKGENGEEIEETVELSSFRGDIINGLEATPESRKPDPARLLDAYYNSAATLNYMRNQLGNGFADLNTAEGWTISEAKSTNGEKPREGTPGVPSSVPEWVSRWDLSHVQKSDIRTRYKMVVDSISHAVGFMNTVGAQNESVVKAANVYTGHEALVLQYEEGLTRLSKVGINGASTGTTVSNSSPALRGLDEKNGNGTVNGSSTQGKWYDTSSHFIWMGDRTRNLDGAHVEFFRGIANPIGIKVGPTMKPDELVSMLDIVDPGKEAGRVTLITRYGHSNIRNLLPAHIRAVKASGHPVVWICDPCHGNTHTVLGLKTRSYGDIASELCAALEIHAAEGGSLHGVHLELTGDDVTECLGGSQELKDIDLAKRYESACDPRLSVSQALDVAFLVADWWGKIKSPSAGLKRKLEGDDEIVVSKK